MGSHASLLAVAVQAALAALAVQAVQALQALQVVAVATVGTARRRAKVPTIVTGEKTMPRLPEP